MSNYPLDRIGLIVTSTKLNFCYISPRVNIARRDYYL